MDKRFNSVTIGHEPPWAASPVSKTALQTFRFLDIWLVGWLVGWLGPKELVEGWTRHHFPSLVRTETSDPDPGWLVGFASACLVLVRHLCLLGVCF